MLLQMIHMLSPFPLKFGTPWLVKRKLVVIIYQALQEMCCNLHLPLRLLSSYHMPIVSILDHQSELELHDASHIGPVKVIVVPENRSPSVIVLEVPPEIGREVFNDSPEVLEFVVHL
jgi:hypothetical protein